MNAALLDPMRGLGYTFAATGRHAAAAALLDRALLVSRRNHGLFDISQQSVLRQLATSLTKLGRAPEAERHMNYLLRVAEQTYGAGSPQLAPTLCLVGDWYSDVAEFDQARAQYRTAIDLVTKKLGRSHLAAVEPLQGLARTYTQELYYSTLGIRTSRERVPTDADGASNEHQAMNPRYLDSEGEKALERALKIIESQSHAAARNLHRDVDPTRRLASDQATEGSRAAALPARRSAPRRGRRSTNRRISSR